MSGRSRDGYRLTGVQLFSEPRHQRPKSTPRRTRNHHDQRTVGLLLPLDGAAPGRNSPHRQAGSWTTRVLRRRLEVGAQRPKLWMYLGPRRVALQHQKAAIHLLVSNGGIWPLPVVQAMKFTRGRPTAACDPF